MSVKVKSKYLATQTTLGTNGHVSIVRKMTLSKFTKGKLVDQLG